MTDVKRLPKVISFEQEKLLLSSCRNIRDKTIIKFMINTGLRVSELCNLKIVDLDLNNRCISIIGKGYKERIVTLNDEVIQYLSDYIAKKKTHSEYVFTAKNGFPLTRNAVWLVLRKASVISGLPEFIHPHMLRHTFCTRLTDNNVSIDKIAELAGHSKLDTTRIYSKVSLNKKYEAVSTLNKKGFFHSFFIKEKQRKLKYNLPLSKMKNDYGFIPDVRKEEIKRIEENLKLKIHTLILCPEGYGKSSILKYLKEKDNAFYMDSLDTKQDIINLYEDLYNNCFFKDETNFKDLKKKFIGLSIPNMIKLIDKNISEDYILIVDDVTNLSKKMKRVFYHLSNYFTILTSSEIKHNIILDKFDAIKLNLLNRKDTIILINSLLNYNEIEEKTLLLIYDIIFTRSQGFPRAVIEMTDKIIKNNYSLNTLVSDAYSNPANQKSIGWLLLLILFVIVAFILKFSSGGFAGAALIYILIIILRFFILRKAYSSG